MTNSRASRSPLSLIRPWFPALVWVLLIFILSGVSIPPGKLRFFRHQDKVVHFIEFGLLGLLLVRGAYYSSYRRVSVYWLCILGASLYGFIDEIRQAWTPNRRPDFADAVADMAGVLTFAWAYLRWKGESLLPWFGRNAGTKRKST